MELYSELKPIAGLPLADNNNFETFIVCNNSEVSPGDALFTNATLGNYNKVGKYGLENPIFVGVCVYTSNVSTTENNTIGPNGTGVMVSQGKVLLDVLNNPIVGSKVFLKMSGQNAGKFSISGNTGDIEVGIVLGKQDNLAIVELAGRCNFKIVE